MRFVVVKRSQMMFSTRLDCGFRRHTARDLNVDQNTPHASRNWKNVVNSHTTVARTLSGIFFTTTNHMIKLFDFENWYQRYRFYHYKSNGHHKLFISWTLSGRVFTPTNRMVRHFIFGNCDQWRLRICTFNFFKNTISLSFLNVQLVQDPEKVGGFLQTFWISTFGSR